MPGREDEPSPDELKPDESGVGDELSVSAARLGQEFGLGSCRSELSARRRATRVGVGRLLIAGTLITAACFSPLLFFVAAAVTRLTATAAVLALVTAGLVLIWSAPPPRVDRTFWYSGGLLQLLATEPEPRVIRWGELASVTMRTGSSSDDDLYVARTTVRDRAGTSIAVDEMYGDQAAPDLARKAIQGLTPWLVPALIRDFDAGERISFGGVGIDREGITNARGPQAAAPLLTRWPDMQRIDIEGPGAAIKVVTGRFSSQRMILDDSQNGPLAHHVIEHAAARHGVEVRYLDLRALPARLNSSSPTGSAGRRRRV